MITKELKEKYNKLKQYIAEQKSAAVAFSAGVDSTFLLKTAKDVLDDKVIAITISSNLFPQRELNEAIDFCKKNNIKHYIAEFDAFNIKGFSQNPPDRCYLCKKELFTKIQKIAYENNTENILEGSNFDDNKDYRPGIRAIKELGIKSPLEFVRLSKNEIRILSKSLNLPSGNKPSFACLATRFVYGETITEAKIKMADIAEQFLCDLGFHQYRVRIHKNIARIEVLPDEFEKIMQNRKQITDKFKNCGFAYVTLDLQGYRTGSMNETL